ncbi:NAD(P)-binding protein [Streptomyces sp. NPDC057565]|uniref:NAD(P)-binding protein n=1 Tax=Streptomyces sp. NPDC057565 TaxID=3346169 RepID=UPI0036753BC0
MLGASQLSDFTDDELGMNRKIRRRDFLDGVALGVGALVAGGIAGSAAAGPASAAEAPRADARYYPPTWQGLRGYTDAAMKVPHALRDGTFWDDAPEPRDTHEKYDLVVVGGGISGLSAARYYQMEFGKNCKILVLDAMDDIGGHARRNEFRTTARTLLSYGGSQSLESPSTYAPPARQLLTDIGIRVERFEKYFDSGFDARHGLGRGLFFDKESWGKDHLVTWQGGTPYSTILEGAPMAAQAKADLAAIYDAPRDWMPGLSDQQKKDKLADITYLDYLRDYVKAHPDAQKFLQTTPNGNWGYGADAVGALDASIEFAGFDGLGLDWDGGPDPRIAPTGHKVWTSEDDYIYHFPEGNAGVVYSLVRKLIPHAMPGQGMETIPTSRIQYGELDRRRNNVRIRLNSPAVRVVHEGDPDSARQVQVSYVRKDRLETVRAEHVVLACNNQIIPFLTSEISQRQRDALKDSPRLALVYTSVLVRNWKALDNLKISGVRFPTGYWTGAELDFPVSMGGYHFPDKPSESAILHVSRAACRPGLPPRRQGAAGRGELIRTSFAEMERNLRDQLARALGPGGFDPARDIKGITVNRWAHAYAYEYGRPWDTFWPYGELPSHVARQTWGRVAIANTDSAPRAYVDSAMDMAWRAVRDLAGKPSDIVSRGVDGIAF